MNKCVILANGKPPKKNVLQYLDKIGYSTLICADGGANTAFKFKLIPEYIIGDLDSISTSVLKVYNSKTKVIQITRQNDTDVEKCLKFAITKGFKEAILTGVTGDRLDHTFCNMGIIIKFFNKLNLSIIAENSILKPYTGYSEIKTIAGEIVSIYGFDQFTKINSHGLKYRLKNISLPFGQKESTSNVAIKNKVILEVSGGIIFVIRDYNIMKKNGLLRTS